MPASLGNKRAKTGSFDMRAELPEHASQDIPDIRTQCFVS
jgi:hypothetical protein